ncbi:MAG: cytochrome c biogenesis protein ResB [Candidatus Dormibacteria bacterium]
MTRRRGEGIPAAVRFYAWREWRTLARMKTAVILLAIVAGLSIVATLLPQKALQPQRASDWIQAHQVLGAPFDRLGLFSVYESWVFIVPLVLMYVSLGNCVFTRSRAMYRRWRRGLPRGPQFIGEAGSLVFHLSFFVLLAGVLYNLAAGFTAYVNVVEGDSVVEARSSYDQVEEGALFSPAQHRGFEVKVDKFDATYYPGGKPRDFVTSATLIDHGRVVRHQDIRVNQYLAYQDVKFYQASFGWAPVVQIFDPSGTKVFDQPVLFSGDANFAHGVLKAPAAGAPGEQLGARMFFAPDAVDTGSGAHAGSADLRNPAMTFAIFKGDLHANRIANVYDLDVSGMRQIWTGGLLEGQTSVIPGGYRVSFPRVLRYTTLQVTTAPGLPIIYTAFGLMLGGLLIRLYLRPLMEWRQGERGRAGAVPASAVATSGPAQVDAPPGSGHRKVRGTAGNPAG